MFKWQSSRFIMTTEEARAWSMVLMWIERPVEIGFQLMKDGQLNSNFVHTVMALNNIFANCASLSCFQDSNKVS